MHSSGIVRGQAATSTESTDRKSLRRREPIIVAPDKLCAATRCSLEAVSFIPILLKIRFRKKRSRGIPDCMGQRQADCSGHTQRGTASPLRDRNDISLRATGCCCNVDSLPIMSAGVTMCKGKGKHESCKRCPELASKRQVPRVKKQSESSRKQGRQPLALPPRHSCQ